LRDAQKVCALTIVGTVLKLRLSQPRYQGLPRDPGIESEAFTVKTWAEFVNTRQE